MAKPSKPWFRESKQTWYCTLDGRKCSLGVKGRENEAEAVKSWHKVMSGLQEAKAKPKPEPSVAEVLTAFLADVEGRGVKPNTIRAYRYFLLPFSEKHGKVKASALTTTVAERYARKPEWSDTSRNDFLGAIATAFKWAERARVITTTPLAGLKRPPKQSRGAEAVIGPDDHERLLAAARKPFKPFLRLLHLTGARPGEVAAITAENFDADNAVVRLKEHKTAYKGKSRTIYLCAEAVALLLEQKSLYGSGVLLRNSLGKPWRGGSIVDAMAATRKRAGVKGTAYGYRHAFATDALANGVPDAHVAELLGHSGTTMLHKHYSHLGAKADTMREAVGKVR